jgi:glucose-1-phosphate thymidylyltransferase
MSGLQLVLICGGRGTRLARSAAKSMLEVAGEPLVGRLLRSLLGLHQSTAPLVVLVAAGNKGVRAFVETTHPEALIVPQPAPDGVANAILLTAPHVRDRALVVLGDLVLDGRFHTPFPTAPAVGIWPEAPAATTRKNFGVRLDDAGRVLAFEEKPKATEGLICGIGVYLLTRKQIESFAGAPVNPATGEREITAAMDYLRTSGGTMATFRFEGHYFNVNSAEDRKRAEDHLRSARPELDRGLRRDL